MTDTYELPKDFEGNKDIVAALLEFHQMSGRQPGSAKFRKEFIKRYNIDTKNDKFKNPFYNFIDKQGRPIVKFRSLMDKIQAIVNERRGVRLTSQQMWNRLEYLGNTAPRPTLKTKKDIPEEEEKEPEQEGDFEGLNPLELKQEEGPTIEEQSEKHQEGLIDTQIALENIESVKTVSGLREAMSQFGIINDIYTGPGTPLVENIIDGKRPLNMLDRIALEHDIRYTTALTDADINRADELFIKRLTKEAAQNPFKPNIVGQSIANVAMIYKTLVDRIPFLRSETIFSDYEQNRNIPEPIKQKLLSIQNKLKDQDRLTEESVEFIFQDDVVKVLKGDEPSKEEETPPTQGKREEKQKEDETPESGLKEEEEPSKEKEESVKALEKVLQDVKMKEDADNLKTLEEQTPGDYRAPPTSNRYLRPAFDEQWLDLARLRQLQDPNFKSAEERLWFENWNTPNQFGEGHITNKVIVDSLTEKIARLEHELRYERANRGLPNDERPPARLFGETSARRGTLQSPFPRYEAGRQLNINMDRYQYMTSTTDLPNRLINREKQQFELTREIPGQQRIYDEMNRQNISEFRPRNQSELHHLYRRIRKR